MVYCPKIPHGVGGIEGDVVKQGKRTLEDRCGYQIFKEEIDHITGKKNTMDIFEQVEEWTLQDVREEALEEGKKLGEEEGI